MFFNFNFMQDRNALNPTATNGTLNGFKITNGNYFWVDLQDVLSITPRVFDKAYPGIEWGETTVARSNFNGTINIGSLSNITENLLGLEVQRSVHDENKWITLITINKKYLSDGAVDFNTNFTIHDTYNANNIVYDYRIAFISNNGAVGKFIIASVLSQFNKAYICDAQQIFDITNEWTVSNVETAQETNMYKPFGSKFPTYVANAETNFRQGTTSAVLLAPTSNTSGHIDRKAQIGLIETVNNFLTNHLGKIIKDFNGNIRVVFVNNAVTNNYYKELGNGIASTTFNWSEITEIDNEDGLKKAGMLNKFPIFFKSTKI